MKYKSLNNARYSMWATVIPKLVGPEDTQPTAGTGKYIRHQDPDSFEIVTVWVPSSQDSSGTDSPQYEIPCWARGYTNLGFRSSGNRETYVKTDYTEIEAIQFDYPATVVLNRQSFVTNIRMTQDPSGDSLWTDGTTGKPVVWEIQGITPVMDPFGKLLRNTTVLKRAEIQ